MFIVYDTRIPNVTIRTFENRSKLDEYLRIRKEISPEDFENIKYLKSYKPEDDFINSSAFTDELLVLINMKEKARNDINIYNKVLERLQTLKSKIKTIHPNVEDEELLSETLNLIQLTLKSVRAKIYRLKKKLDCQ